MSRTQASSRAARSPPSSAGAAPCAPPEARSSGSPARNTNASVASSDARVTPEGHKKFVSDQINQLKTVIDAAGQYAD